MLGMKAVVLSPGELEAWLVSRKDQITELALGQPLFAARPDDIGYGVDLLAGYLQRNWISYDKDDSECERAITMAVTDYVLFPLKNRRL
jgi:hypothetical protein